MTFLTTATPMNKTHQIWQATNAMAMGFSLGQMFPVLDRPIASLLVLAVAISVILETRFNKRDVSGWRNGKLP